MYNKRSLPEKTTLKRSITTKGETIEQKMFRIVNNGEPAGDGAPIIYTERKDGVKPEYDIRTDRFEIAVEKMDAYSKSNTAKREERIGDEAKKNMAKEDAQGESAAENPGKTPN